MIGALISGLFNFVLGLVATVIQIIVLPINALITSALPNFADALTGISQGFNTLFTFFYWILDIIPPTLLFALGFCATVRLAAVVISRSTHTLVRVWNILQKVKFW